jgi:hypothetical protein
VLPAFLGWVHIKALGGCNAWGFFIFGFQAGLKPKYDFGVESAPIPNRSLLQFISKALRHSDVGLRGLSRDHWWTPVLSYYGGSQQEATTMIASAQEIFLWPEATHSSTSECQLP